MEKANIVITHGGTGAIIGAVKKGKKVIAVPRLAKYGEHVDDHQLQLIKQFDDLADPRMNVSDGSVYTSERRDLSAGSNARIQTSGADQEPCSTSSYRVPGRGT